MTHIYTQEYFQLVATAWIHPEERNKTPPPEQRSHGVRGRFGWSGEKEEVELEARRKEQEEKKEEGRASCKSDVKEKDSNSL